MINSDLGRQQEILFSLCNQYLLTNLVDKPTRGENLLDVILCNDRDLFLRCESLLNVKFSDHNLVKVTLTVNTSCNITQCENLSYPSVIPQYNWRQGTTQQWEEYRKEMELFDWFEEAVNLNLEEKVSYLTKIMEKSIDKVFDKKCERVNKRIIPLKVRKLITRKKKISKAIMKTQCKTQISTLKSEYIEVENILSES